MSKFLSRDAILNAPDVEVQEIEIPEWGGNAYIREMTTAEVEHFSMQTQTSAGTLDTSKMGGLRAKVVVWCLVDETGQAVLKLSDVEALQKKSNKVVDRIFDAILTLSGLSEEEIGAGGNVPKT